MLGHAVACRNLQESVNVKEYFILLKVLFAKVCKYMQELACEGRNFHGLSNVKEYFIFYKNVISKISNFLSTLCLN